jgi:hypothetical protein
MLKMHHIRTSILKIKKILNLLKLFNWEDWQATSFLVLNDAVANAVKLKKHHMRNELPMCLAWKSNNLDVDCQ